MSDRGTCARAMCALFMFAAIAAAAMGCKVDPAANTGQRCRMDQDCGGQKTCYRGFCVGENVTLECTQEGEIVSCYDGPAGTSTIGSCRRGERQCVGGRYSSCFGQVMPLPGELTCNGIDDDCDGRTDEFDDVSCDTQRPGKCGPGEHDCRGSDIVCLGTSGPTPEICNSEDDDCDGENDEAIMVSCFTGSSGCVASDNSWMCRGICQSGFALCTDGQLSECAGEVLAALEVCTSTSGTELAIDENCDGQVDEGCGCEEAVTFSCYSGPPTTRDTLPCRAGTITCDVGGLGPCVNEVLPGFESCGNEGADNDCDGLVDNIPGRGSPCSDMSAFGICREGIMECGATANFDCQRPAPLDRELCNELDDNCNNQTDEGYDLYNDRNNCGECGNRCADGFTCCGGDCVDLSNDRMFCGSCTNRCADSEECCDGECVDTQTDADHCNTCFNDCGPDRSCCDGMCIDTRSEEAYCGSCDVSCANGQSCCNSQCAAPNAPACTGCTQTCGPGQTCCAPNCVNTNTDAANCGSCGQPCGPGQLCCNGACVANNASPNCGACGVTCTAGTEQCCNGMCRAINAASCQNCMPCGPNQDCCGGTCVSLLADPHCGQCGNDCPMGQLCCNGGCVVPNASPNCGACGVTCNPTTERCCNGMCTPLSASSCQNCAPCGANQDCCGGACVSIQADPNCGSCGNDCPGGQGCCGGGCVPLNTPDNCGGCGCRCSGLEFCSGGQCCFLLPLGGLTCHSGCN